MRKILIILLLSVFLFANEELLLNSANAFIMTERLNKKAPFEALIKQSKAVVIIPSVKKVGFLVGGMGGSGVIVIDPLSDKRVLKSVTIGGGSLGLQMGYEDSSLVIFVLKSSIVADISDGKLAINADASFSFGDVGGGYKSIKDFEFSKDMYAYATNGGFFAGASFGGVIINSSNKIRFRSSGYAYDQLILALNR
ncbi:lipid-binding SYLF domain-containing protein [Campylobacter gastrosuis]|uniref:Lipid-binding SYLF domain-containing protein n=1 Tax=Campylobacter gastrosuis TaxID=2974576 RepID=A0ABT7HSX4_9BACT|nr:lipid-binding SYLF domain-containing protein [Campylobacter gastrosuis]MDL0089718.1 lipid-binding SYLF domain-containing protein [Campylobacter gastrosuis]